MHNFSAILRYLFPEKVYFTLFKISTLFLWDKYFLDVVENVYDRIDIHSKTEIIVVKLGKN
jgi:hypothetical protein